MNRQTIRQIQKNLDFYDKKLCEVIKQRKEFEQRVVDDIIDWRIQKGLSQNALAYALDISKGYMSDILKGRRSLSKSVIAKLKNIL